MAARIDPIQWVIFGAVGFLALIAGYAAGFDPAISMGMAAAVAYALLVFANLPAALALYCCEPFGYSWEESALARIAVVILVVSWLGVLMVRGSGARKLFVEHPGISLVLLLFLAWSLLSLTWAENLGHGFDATGRYTSGVAVLFIAYTVIRTREHAAWVCAALVGGATIAAVWGIVFGLRDGDRLMGVSLDPNELASVLVPAVALSAALLPSVRRSPFLAGLLIASAMVGMVGIVWSGSREGLLGLGGVLLLGIILGGRWRPQVAIASLLVVGMGSVYLTAFAPHEQRDRILHATDAEQREHQGRVALWTVGWRIASAHPLNGVGAGNFQDSARHYVLRPGPLTVTTEIIDAPAVSHSTYVELLTGLGVVGLGLFLIIDIFSLTSAAKAIGRFKAAGDIRGEALARGVLIALIGLEITHAFHSDEGNKQLWLLLALGPALLAISEAARTRFSDDEDATT